MAKQIQIKWIIVGIAIILILIYLGPQTVTILKTKDGYQTIKKPFIMSIFSNQLFSMERAEAEMTEKAKCHVRLKTYFDKPGTEDLIIDVTEWIDKCCYEIDETGETGCIS